MERAASEDPDNAFTAGLGSTCSITVRRCDRSGPMAAARWRWKWTRRMRETLRSVRGGPSSSSAIAASEIGSLNCTMVWRPFTIELRKRHMRPPISHDSVKKILATPVSLSGARPIRMVTGTSWMSSTRSSQTFSTKRLRVSEWRRTSGRRTIKPVFRRIAR